MKQNLRSAIEGKGRGPLVPEKIARIGAGDKHVFSLLFSLTLTMIFLGDGDSKALVLHDQPHEIYRFQMHSVTPSSTRQAFKMPIDNLKGLSSTGTSETRAVMSSGRKENIQTEQTRYQLVMSRDNKVCSYMLKTLNAALERYGQKAHREQFQDPVFTAVNWIPLRDGFDYVGEAARFDINNDGRADLVIRQHTSGGKNVSFDRIFVLDQNVGVESVKASRDLYDKAIGMISIDMRDGYDFKMLPPRTFKKGILKGREYFEGLSWAVSIYPLIFENVSYVLLKRSIDSGADPYWLAIAQYKRGKVEFADSELIEDICYMK